MTELGHFHKQTYCPSSREWTNLSFFGSVVRIDGESTEETWWRIVLARDALSKLSVIWKGSLAINKLRLLKTLVFLGQRITDGFDIQAHRRMLRNHRWRRERKNQFSKNLELL